MRPVAVTEAEKDAQRVSNDSSELPHRVALSDIQGVHRIDKAVGEHQKGRLMKMRNEEQQKVFMAELLEVCFPVDEYALTAIPHHRKDASGAHEARPGSLLSLSIPVAVVAEAFFKIAEVTLGVR